MRGGFVPRGRGGGGPPRGGPSFALNNGGRLPFDLTFSGDIFPRVGAEPDDTPLTTVRLNSKT